MGSVIFEAVPGTPSRIDGYGYTDATAPKEWLVNFRVPAAGNDGGLIAVVNSREAAEALAKVLNAATRLADNGRFP